MNKRPSEDKHSGESKNRPNLTIIHTSSSNEDALEKIINALGKNPAAECICEWHQTLNQLDGSNKDEALEKMVAREDFIMDDMGVFSSSWKKTVRSLLVHIWSPQPNDGIYVPAK